MSNHPDTIEDAVLTRPCVLFRSGSWAEESEVPAARKFLPTVEQRTQVPPGSLVVPRYAALPFYRELERDIEILGSRLLNSYREHRFAADFWKWYEVLRDLTPQSWPDWSRLPEGAFVIKGGTNSRKAYWKTRMFAQTREEVPRVACSLMDDAEILEQGLVVRQYVPLVQYGEGINGIPITNEWRFFLLDGRVLLGGYYWANEPDLYPGDPRVPPPSAVRLARRVAQRVRDWIRFSVVDVAETQAGQWIVIEMNDGQQSGLPVCGPEDLYRKLAERLG